MKRAAWTEDRIEKETLALIGELGHFPSTTELKTMRRFDLSNALCRNGGMIAWSKRLGYERAVSDSDVGWDGEEDVKAILESKGFSVGRSKEVKAPYDLLVNGRVRIDVKTASQATYNLNTGQPWSAWFYRIGKKVQSDIVILYRKDERDCFILPWWQVGTTNITISPKSPKYGRFKDRYDIVASFDQSIRALQSQIF